MYVVQVRKYMQVADRHSRVPEEAQRAQLTWIDERWMAETKIGTAPQLRVPFQDSGRVVMSAGQRECVLGRDRAASYRATSSATGTRRYCKGREVQKGQSRARNVKSAGQPRTRLMGPASKPASKRQATTYLLSRPEPPDAGGSQNPERYGTASPFARGAKREGTGPGDARENKDANGEEPDAGGEHWNPDNHMPNGTGDREGRAGRYRIPLLPFGEWTHRLDAVCLAAKCKLAVGPMGGGVVGAQLGGVAWCGLHSSKVPAGSVRQEVAWLGIKRSPDPVGLVRGILSS